MKCLRQLIRLFRTSANPWMCALQLTALNLTIAGFCCVSFVGGIELVAWINQERLDRDRTADEFPFPYPVLFLLYVFLFIGAWLWFARRLSPLPSRGKLIATIVGASPLFGLALIGYLAAVVMVFAGGDIPPAGPFMSGLISTLIILAGATQVGLLLILSSRWRAQSSGQ